MYRTKQQRKSPLQRWIGRNKSRVPVYIFVFLLLTFYLAGIINQLTRINFLSEEKTVYTFEVFKCIKHGLTGGAGGILLMLILWSVIAYRIYMRNKDLTSRDLKDDKRGYQTDESGILGSNTLMEKDQVRDFLEVEPLKRTTGTIIAKFIPEDGDKNSTKEIISISPDGKRIKHDATGKAIFVRDPVTKEKKYKRERLETFANSHLMVNGPSGSGKSYCIALPMIFQRIRMGESYVTSDPKGELYAVTSKYAEDNGYTVKILNLAHPEVSDSWNVIEEARKNGDNIDIEIMNMSKLIISNTESPNGKSDAGITSAAETLLLALLMFIVYEMPPDKKVFGSVMDLLQLDDEELNAEFMAAANEMPKLPWRDYYKGSEKFRGNVRSELANRLKTLYSENIRNMTGIPDIDLPLPGREKAAYYIIMEDMNTTFKFLSSLFFTSLINSLVNYSRKQPERRLPKKVYFVLDEFAAIGYLPDFDKKLATVRSDGIVMTIIFQTLSQIQNLYPDSWETLVANCQTMVCLKCADITTAEYLSKRSGTSSVATETTSATKPMVDFAFVPDSVQHSYSTGSRELLTVGDVLTFPPDELLISVTGADLFFAKKFPYTDLIDPSTLTMQNMYSHNPSWREKLRTDAEDIGRKQIETPMYREARERRGQSFSIQQAAQSENDTDTGGENLGMCEEPTEKKGKKTAIKSNISSMPDSLNNF